MTAKLPMALVTRDKEGLGGWGRGENKQLDSLIDSGALTYGVRMCCYRRRMTYKPDLDLRVEEWFSGMGCWS